MIRLNPSRPPAPVITRLALAALAAITAIAFAGCGSGSGQTGSERGDSYVVPSSDPISDANRPTVPRPTWPGPNSRSVPVSPSGGRSEAARAPSTAVDPCRLVSSAEASEILGDDVDATVGMQGPTCIYAPRGKGPQMTLVVERTSLAGLRHQAATATRMPVGGDSGWCLQYGSTSVVTQLPDGSVLHVTGPCNLAARFAGRALSRIERS